MSMQNPVPVKPKNQLLNLTIDTNTNDGMDIDYSNDMMKNQFYMKPNFPYNLQDVKTPVQSSLNLSNISNFNCNTPVTANTNSNFYKNNQDSNISLASTVSDYPVNNNKNEKSKQQFIASFSNNFTREFVNLLMEVYSNLVSDPLLTPFDYTNPPSGILNKAAKISIEESKRQNIEIGIDKNNWLLTVIRFRLQQEIRNEFGTSRANSVVSTTPGLPSNLQTNFNELLNNYANNNNASSGTLTGILQPAALDFSRPSINTQDLLLNSCTTPVSRGPLTPINGFTQNIANLNRSRSNSSQIFNHQPQLSRTASNNLLLQNLKDRA